MKLKTLKDWVKDITEPDIMNVTTCCMVRGDFVKEQFIEDVDKLKQEAIKWVKKYGWGNLWVEGLIQFCNITEDDLK